MMKQFVQNLLNGARLALLIDCKDDAFDTSWQALLFVVAVFAAYSIGFDLLGTDAPFTFNSYGFVNELVMLAFLMLGANVTAVLFGRPDRGFSLTVVLYYALMLPWLCHEALFAAGPEWLEDEENMQAVYTLFAVWYFLTAFRAVTLSFETAPLRQLAGGALLVAALLAPGYFYIYEARYWYTEYPEANQDYYNSPLYEISHEELFTMQDQLINRQAASLRSSRPGEADMYALVAGSYGQQEVFRREVEYIRNRLEDSYGMQGRIVTLLNNRDTIYDYPLAMPHNIEAGLNAIAARMQEEDILLLYLTSHGGMKCGLSVQLGRGIEFERINGPRIAEALDASGIKNRVVMISACYSGAMIDDIKGDNTLIMTAAAANRTSFGCSDRLDMTYFAHAFFKQALPYETDLIRAFEIAKQKIREREDRQGIEKHSDPQIFIGDGIEEALAAYAAPEPLYAAAEQNQESTPEETTMDDVAEIAPANAGD